MEPELKINNSAQQHYFAHKKVGRKISTETALEMKDIKIIGYLPVEGKLGGLVGNLEQRLHSVVGQLVDVESPTRGA